MAAFAEDLGPADARAAQRAPHRAALGAHVVGALVAVAEAVVGRVGGFGVGVDADPAPADRAVPGEEVGGPVAAVPLVRLERDRAEVVVAARPVFAGLPVGGDDAVSARVGGGDDQPLVEGEELLLLRQQAAAASRSSPRAGRGRRAPRRRPRRPRPAGRRRTATPSHPPGRGCAHAPSGPVVFAARQEPPRPERPGAARVEAVQVDVIARLRAHAVPAAADALALFLLGDDPELRIGVVLRHQGRRAGPSRRLEADPGRRAAGSRSRPR